MKLLYLIYMPLTSTVTLFLNPDFLYIFLAFFLIHFLHYRQNTHLSKKYVLSYQKNFQHIIILEVFLNKNAADRNRTGTGITTHRILSPGRLPVPPLRHTTILNCYNGTYRARTCDPLLVRQMLSQLS